MPAQPTQPKSHERVDIIGAVKTYLGFFVLVVLVVEAVLGALALNSQGPNQLVAMYGMLFVILLLVAIVSFFAYRKPHALLHTAGDGELAAEHPSHVFCSRIAGHWWERITPHTTSAISFVDMRLDPATGTVKMKGLSYDKDGRPEATWESIASCINPGEGKVFFYWQGRHPARPAEPYEGFGEVSFHEFSGKLDSGVGLFSDTNMTDLSSTTKKSIEFRRSTEAETRVMLEGDGKRIVELVTKKLADRP